MTARGCALSYGHDGRAEHVFGFGQHDDAAPCLLIVPPLFAEMSRMRRTIVLAMQHLCDHGIASRLIDLPGSHESLADPRSQSLSTLRAAVAEAARQLQATHILSLRGGCLIDDATAQPVFRLAPAKGTNLLRTMLRTRIASARETGETLTLDGLMEAGRANGLELGGYALGPDMLAQLDQAEPSPLPGAVERSIGAQGLPGSALWLRAEPGEDIILAQAMADAIRDWIG